MTTQPLKVDRIVKMDHDYTRPRTRIAHLVIQPVLVHDDGEELTPGPQLEAATVTISQLEDYVAKLREFIDQQNVSAEDSQPAEGQ